MTYVFWDVSICRISNTVPTHFHHNIFSKDNNLSCTILNATWVGSKLCIWHSLYKIICNYFRYWRSADNREKVSTGFKINYQLHMTTETWIDYSLFKNSVHNQPHINKMTESIQWICPYLSLKFYKQIIQLESELHVSILSILTSIYTCKECVIKVKWFW